MTIANFPYRVRAEITDEVSLPSIVLTMGDGYKYRYPDGLNLPKTIWNIECPLDDRNAETNLEAFLERVGNDVPFMWQSPRDCQPRYYFIVGKVGGRYRVGGGAKKDFQANSTFNRPIYYASLKLDAPAEERHRAMARAKYQLGVAMRFVGQQAVQLHGGIGVTDEYIVSHYFKKLTQLEMSFGDTLHHLGEVSKHMQDTAGVFA